MVYAASDVTTIAAAAASTAAAANRTGVNIVFKRFKLHIL